MDTNSIHELLTGSLRDFLVTLLVGLASIIMVKVGKWVGYNGDLSATMDLLRIRELITGLGDSAVRAIEDEYRHYVPLDFEEKGEAKLEAATNWLVSHAAEYGIDIEFDRAEGVIRAAYERVYGQAKVYLAESLGKLAEEVGVPKDQVLTQ